MITWTVARTIYLGLSVFTWFSVSSVHGMNYSCFYSSVTLTFYVLLECLLS